MVQHPASAIPFEELYTALLEEVKQQNVTRIRGVGEQEGLEIFDYTQSCQFDKKWNKYNLLARGLLLCPAEKRVVGHTFQKFFNYGEHASDLPDLPFRATFKMDGSLGIVYHWKGKWYVNTRGSFASPQAQWATKYIQQYTENLVPGTTYLAEIIYPENRIVVQYDFSGMVLLGAYAANGLELEYEDLQVVGQQTGLRVVESFPCTNLEQLLALVKVFDENQEGVVIRYPNGHRIKVKGDKYTSLHRMIAEIRPLCIWEQLLLMKEEDLSKIPDEFAKEYRKIRAILVEKEAAQHVELVKIAEQYKDLSDKEVGMKFVEIKKVSPMGKFLFDYRKGKFETDFTRIDLTKQEPVTILRRSFYDMFRPTANRLPGYTPSSSMNAFEAEG
jgi:RNA ligase